MNRFHTLNLKPFQLIEAAFKVQKATLINVNVNASTVKTPEECQNMPEENPVAFPNINPSPRVMHPPNLIVQHNIVKENVQEEQNMQPVEYVDPSLKLEALRNSLPFDAMPGPKSIQMLAKCWNFFPLLNKYDDAVQKIVGANHVFGYIRWYNNLSLFQRMIREYGPVVRLQGPFGGNMVILLRLEDALALFKTEGAYPIRSCIDSLEQYRLQHRKYKHAGPFLTCGQEWKKMRGVVETLFSDYLDYQVGEIGEATHRFIERILRIRNRQDEVFTNFYKEINKWSLECICSLLLNKRFGFLEASGLNISSEPSRILESVTETVTAIQRCEFGVHLWKFIETPGWKSLLKNCDALDTIFNRYVHKAQDSLKLKNNYSDSLTAENISLLESLLLKEEISSEDTLTILLDMVIIGSSAVAHGLAFLLYHLSRYPNVQRKLYDEIKNTPNNITRQDVMNMSYLQACIKESLRLKQPIPILSRVLSEHSLIHNYQVPKDTHILIPTQLYTLKEEYFEDSLKFKPERWLDDDLELCNIKLSTLPFGCGVRSCFAQSLTEMQLGVAAVQLLRQFRVEYQYGEINSTNRMISTPDRPLKFSFINRN